MLIDVHAHLSDVSYLGKGDEIAERCAKDNLIIIDTGADRATSEDAYGRAQRMKNVFCAVGIHPEYADKLTADDEKWLLSVAQNEKTVAIGEMGLDYHYEQNPDRQTQKNAFVKQLEIACEIGLPPILHIRDAHGDAVMLLEENRELLKNGFLLHCYSGSKELLPRYAKLGAFFSYGGAITFKNAKDKPDVIKATPKDRILLETDCPYMTPEPLRGRQNFPDYIRLTARKMSEILGITEKETEKITTENAQRLFKKLKI